MSGKFRKAAGTQPKAVHKKARPPVKQPKKKSGDSKTAVTRVGDSRAHHDTLSTKVLYLLVDQPLEPEDSANFDQGAQQWPMVFTTNGQPLYDTVLVFVLTFEHVADTGKCTLKLQRGDSLAELFTGVETKDLNDDNFVFGPKPSQDEPVNKRVLDLRVVAPRPDFDDKDLDWAEDAYASITEGG